MTYKKLPILLKPVLALDVEFIEAPILFSLKPISPLGDIDPDQGVISDPESNVKGESIARKILVTPYFRGSTVGPYILFTLHKKRQAPLMIVVERIDPMLITGCVISKIPLYKAKNILSFKELSGLKVKITRNGEVYVKERSTSSS